MENREGGPEQDKFEEARKTTVASPKRGGVYGEIADYKTRVLE